MSRIRIRESLLPRNSPSGPSGVQQTYLRAVAQLPHLAPEAHPPRADLPINLGRKVWGFSDGASQIEAKEVVWRYCCPVALETICVAGESGIGVHMVSVLLSKMVRPNAPKISTKTVLTPSKKSFGLTRVNGADSSSK